MEFIKFNKIPRLNRDIIITEKIDGTNAQVYNLVLSNPTVNQRDDFAVKGWRIFDYGFYSFAVIPASRNKFLTLKKDNFGFAKWVHENAEELIQLGPGRHYGEWWGKGVQRNYGLTEKRFSLFNVSTWKTSCSDAEGYTSAPGCCGVIPTLYTGPMNMNMVDYFVSYLIDTGSIAAPGFMKPEGVVVFHTAANQYFKVTCENDEVPKNMKMGG
jgi:hypothetical protein